MQAPALLTSRPDAGPPGAGRVIRENKMAKAGASPLVAGNWKMNGLRASRDRARARSGGAYARPARRQGRPDRLPAGDARHGLRPRRPRRGRRRRRPGLPRQGVGRAHRRRLGRDAGRRRRRRYVIVGHSERRADHGETDADRPRQGRGRAGAPGSWPSSASARRESEREAGEALDGRRPRSSPARCPTAPTAADTSSSPTSRSGRSAPASPRPSPTSPRCTPASARSSRSASARRAPHPHPLRRLGQARQRRASCWRSPNVDGALVGGASLKAADFLAIAKAACG